MVNVKGHVVSDFNCRFHSDFACPTDRPTDGQTNIYRDVWTHLKKEISMKTLITETNREALLIGFYRQNEQ